jgi:hypothetical protein
VARGDNLTLHLGFNGWNHVPGPSLQQETDGTGNVNHFLRQAMSRLPDHSGFEATVPLPAGARAIHFVFFTTTPTGQTWDNNGGRDFNREVLFPYVGPLLSLMGDSHASTEVHVSFHTGHACLGRVEYGPTPSLGASLQEPTPTTAHALHVQGLTPGAPFSYRVSCQGAGTSPVHTARTMPEGATSLTFAVFSDTQDDGERTAWSRTATELASRLDHLDLLLSAGDNAWNDQPGHWWHFFDVGRALFSARPFMAVPGNHDTPTSSPNADTSSFEHWFHFDPASGSEIASTFRLGPARFLSLGSERHAEFSPPSGAQFLFTQQVLGQPDAPTWTFASWHIPPYNAGSRHFGEVGYTRDITQLFDGMVDWVFCGHEHLYQRSKPIRYNAQLVSAYGNGSGDGVGYVVTPPAGAWPHGQLVPSSDPKAYYRDRLAYPSPADMVSSEVGFVLVSLSGRTFTLQALGLGSLQTPVPAHVVDELTYTK